MLNPAGDFRSSYSSAKGLNLAECTGLLPSQYQFLTTRGATGQPKLLSTQPFNKLELQQEHHETKKLIELTKLKDNLQRYRETKIQTNSIFDARHPTISLQNWSVFLLRITKPVGNQSSGSGSGGNRHVYGLLEGLDQLNKRIFVRFDLVEDSSNQNYARVKVKIEIANGLGIQDGQQAFMNLFVDSRLGTPQELICHHAGSLDLMSILSLLEKILSDQSRQCETKNEQKNEETNSRIRYRLIGGKEQNVDTHNCLTWLRHVLSPYKLNLPRSSWDVLYADPKSALSENSIFSTSPNDLTLQKIDVSTWLNLPSANSQNSINNGKSNN